MKRKISTFLLVDKSDQDPETGMWHISLPGDFSGTPEHIEIFLTILYKTDYNVADPLTCIGIHQCAAYFGSTNILDLMEGKLCEFFHTWGGKIETFGDFGVGSTLTEALNFATKMGMANLFEDLCEKWNEKAMRDEFRTKLLTKEKGPVLSGQAARDLVRWLFAEEHSQYCESLCSGFDDV